MPYPHSFQYSCSFIHIIGILLKARLARFAAPPDLAKASCWQTGCIKVADAAPRIINSGTHRFACLCMDVWALVYVCVCHPAPSEMQTWRSREKKLQLHNMKTETFNYDCYCFFVQTFTWGSSARFTRLMAKVLAVQFVLNW